MGSYALCSLFRIVSNSVMACTGLWSFQGKNCPSPGMEKVFSKVEKTLLHNKEGFVECSARDGKDVICGSC